MKTLAVLSALVAVAIAAPTLPQEEDPQKTITNFPDPWQRQKKSPQELDLDANGESPANQPSASQLSEFGLSGRSITLKKPIIVKRKQGIHVYRDSDEEPMDSGEVCGNQVKVKLCDPNTTPMRSTTIEDVKHQTEDEMQHNIQLAKEAIENLQRDLKNEENAKTWVHGQSPSDAKLHQDIEVAREALEHIHQSIGKLESINVPATLPAPTQPKESAIAETEEQRLAQWKEAMENIKKNSEIARNIKDSFRDQTDISGLVSDTQDLTSLSLKAAEEMKMTKEDTECKDKNLQKKSCSPLKITKEVQDDMAPSPSTNSDVVIKRHQDAMKEKHALENTDPVQKEIFNSAMDTISFEESTQKPKTLTSESMKVLEEPSQLTTEENHVMANQNMDTDVFNNKAKSSDSMSATNSEKMKTKEIENMNTMKTTDLVNEKSHPDMKSAALSENDAFKKEDQMMNKEQMSVNPAKTMSSQHSSSLNQERKALPEDTKHPTEAMITSHLEKMPSRHHLQSFLHPEMRSADEMNSMAKQHIMDHFTTHKMQPMVMTDEMLSQHANKMAGQHMHHAASSHHPTELQHARLSNMMMHPKTADKMDMQMYYMNTRDGQDMDSQRFRWKGQHEGMPMDMRSAYGAPAGPAPIAPSSGGGEGAIGVFPSANLPANYAIPLLLSCNPSVVRGNLAKSHTPYPAPPAYRSEDDFNFHNMKRDVRKFHESISATLPQKTLQQSNLKSSVLGADQ